MIGCQRGAEKPLKASLAPFGWRLAFSRPGFVTFKHDDPSAPLPRDPFARVVSHSLGRGQDAHATRLTEQLVQAAAAQADQLPRRTEKRPFDQLHVWARDRAVVGEFGFEPHAENLLVGEVARLAHAAVADARLVEAPLANQIAGRGQRVLDVMLVEPGQWWFGWHLADELPSRWPGAIQPIDADKHVISRAYYKVAEAMAWSGLAMRPGDHVFEIGSAPGGACQRLLEMGMRVTGIDPAEMDPVVAEQARFEHVLARSDDLKLDAFRQARWLIVDANIKPAQTLRSVERLATSDRLSIAGMLLTLKLGTYERAAEISGWIERVTGWGFQDVQVRQLATGRCEVCLAALRQGPR